MTDVDLSKGLSSLAEPSVKKVAIANPQSAPYGKQAVNAFKHENIYPKVSSRLVYGENIAQTNQFITTKAVDAGITAKSIVLAPNMKDQGKWIEIEKASYDPIAQGVVILKHAEKEHMAAAQKFFDFLFSADARTIFEKYGYQLP